MDSVQIDQSLTQSKIKTLSNKQLLLVKYSLSDIKHKKIIAGEILNRMQKYKNLDDAISAYFYQNPMDKNIINNYNKFETNHYKLLMIQDKLINFFWLFLGQKNPFCKDLGCASIGEQIISLTKKMVEHNYVPAQEDNTDNYHYPILKLDDVASLIYNKIISNTDLVNKLSNSIDDSFMLTVFLFSEYITDLVIDEYMNNKITLDISYMDYTSDDIICQILKKVTRKFLINLKR